MGTSRSLRSSAPQRLPRVMRVPAGGRHRFTGGRIAGVLTPLTGSRALTSAAAAPAADGGAWTGRALRTIAGTFVITWAFRLSGYLTSGPWLAVAVVMLGLTGLLAIVAAWLPERVLGRRGQRAADWAVLIAVLAALGLWSYFQVFAAPDYGTDEVAFDQYAAQLALHGANPYLH